MNKDSLRDDKKSFPSLASRSINPIQQSDPSFLSASILHCAPTSGHHVENLISDYSASPSAQCSVREERSMLLSSNKKPSISRIVTDSLEDNTEFISQDSRSLPLDVKPGFVRPIVKSGWNNPNINYMPSIYILERSHRFLDLNLHEPSVMLENLANCFRILSLWVKYADNSAGAALLSPEQIEMYVYIWNVKGGEKMCVEVQHRRGDSLIFHKYARHILEAASGNFHPKEFLGNDAKLDFLYVKEAEKSMKIECARGLDHKISSSESIDYVLQLISDERLATRILGMESLCILSDIRKSTMSVAHSISRCVLSRDCEDEYGKIHDFIFYIIQKRCMPDEDMILAEMVVDDDSDDEEYFDDEDSNSDRPSEYQEAMRCLIMHGFTILANCLEVISIAESCHLPPERIVEYGSSGSRFAAKVLQAASRVTHIHLLSTLLEVVSEGHSQPHNASKAARCLKHLCRLLPEARDVLLKNNASEIILQAQRIGLAIHARLENECSELLQVLYH